MQPINRELVASNAAPLFVSHGAPDLVLARTPAHDFLSQLGHSINRPNAILTVSAHFETERPALVRDGAPKMIYDFGGFDPALRQIVYAAPGAPDVATKAFDLLESAGYEPGILEKRGYDHGVWVPLALAYPNADVPIAQLSVVPSQTPEFHYNVGRALAPLIDDKVLIVASGSLTHNLAEVFGASGQRSRTDTVPDWVSSFADWMSSRLEARDHKALLNYRSLAPYAERNHPTDEHLLPLFVALGAAGEDASGIRIHSSGEFGVLAMDAYQFAN